MNTRFKITVLLIFIYIGLLPNYMDSSKEIKRADLNEPYFLRSNNPSEHLDDALEYYGVKYPNIVKAQAILETGHFSSNVCKSYNNLFGLYNSSKGDYYRFNHWSESVKAYIDYVQYKYDGGDYYAFLDDLGYAEDKQYVSKLKVIVANHKY